MQSEIMCVHYSCSIFHDLRPQANGFVCISPSRHVLCSMLPVVYIYALKGIEYTCTGLPDLPKAMRLWQAASTQPCCGVPCCQPWWSFWEHEQMIARMCLPYISHVSDKVTAALHARMSFMQDRGPPSSWAPQNTTFRHSRVYKF